MKDRSKVITGQNQIRAALLGPAPVVYSPPPIPESLVGFRNFMEIPGGFQCPSSV
jgi:hypothetical protein